MSLLFISSCINAFSPTLYLSGASVIPVNKIELPVAFHKNISFFTVAVEFFLPGYFDRLV